MKRSMQAAGEEVLSLLQKKRRTFLSTKEISEKLRVHPYVVYQAIKELRRWDFEISSEKGKGYRLLKSPDLILPGEVKRKLSTKIMGKEVLSYRSLGSTNQLGFRLAEAGAREGALILADEQTRGRGRMGRDWYSPPGMGLWISLILRPNIPPFKAPGLSICAGLALAQTIKRLTRLDARIKWPNDCLINGLKVGGILLELSAELDRTNFVIAGVGVNVNHLPRDFPKKLSARATSIRIEWGKEVSRVRLLTSFLQRFESLYLDFKKKGLSPQRQLIKKFSFLLGKKVAVKFGREKIEGLARDIDDYGSLVIRTPRGEKVVRAGEVTVL
ncbi:MAG: biotin--[acetyl-CoA-carboxylase] ligase [Candidatus Zixiibacteriota bacterium]|nr:MAG: biotin--[acetyl-CoA-carboxylase] ligase [candidate division Zixibacteria bacterium]